jgi:uncharacterized SAM-binding protein YcdF (DUF218 family)
MSACRKLWIAFGATVFLVLAALAFAGRFLAAPAEAPARADLVVALGGDGGSRVQTAADLYVQGLAPRVLLTGIDQGDAAVRPRFLEWRAALLVERGVPVSALLFDEVSANSWQEAGSVRALMLREGWTRVIVVSDPPHQRRLSWVWSRTFRESGLEYSLVAAGMPGWDARNWWRDERSAQFVLMELIKLAYYVFRY